MPNILVLLVFKKDQPFGPTETFLHFYTLKDWIQENFLEKV